MNVYEQPIRMGQSGPHHWRQQREVLADSPLVQSLLDTLPTVVMVLNDQRQLVTANQALFDLLGADPQQLLGQRPGDILGCIHAGDSGRCGTTRFCAYCGMANAILRSASEGRAVRECRIRKSSDGGTGCLDLRVKATPLHVGGQQYTVCAIEDISDEKRRRALEGVFFHDIRNTVSAVISCAGLLKSLVADSEADVAEDLCHLAHRLHHEIQSQKLLLDAENGDLAPNKATVRSSAVIEEVRRASQNLQVARERMIRIADDCKDVSLSTDPTLLSRVLSNMVKNALEATDEGGEVSIGCRTSDGGVEFWTWNATAMPPEVALQVFQRSFSTKGSARGLGTYSMKLLSERYLGGRVSFSTSEEQGTIFRAWYPKSP